MSYALKAKDPEAYAARKEMLRQRRVKQLTKPPLTPFVSDKDKVKTGRGPYVKNQFIAEQMNVLHDKIEAARKLRQGEANE